MSISLRRARLAGRRRGTTIETTTRASRRRRVTLCTRTRSIERTNERTHERVDGVHPPRAFSPSRPRRRVPRGKEHRIEGTPRDRGTGRERSFFYPLRAESRGQVSVDRAPSSAHVARWARESSVVERRRRASSLSVVVVVVWRRRPRSSRRRGRTVRAGAFGAGDGRGDATVAGGRRVDGRGRRGRYAARGAREGARGV